MSTKAGQLHVDPPASGKRRFGYSRDKRFDCVQVVIALIVTPEGFPLGYEVLPGNTVDNQTLKDALAKIEARYGQADRVWVMDRGIPTEESLALMRGYDPPVHYLVGTPKGRLSKLARLRLRPTESVEMAPADAVKSDSLRLLDITASAVRGL